jgi:hypothetical protein
VLSHAGERGDHLQQQQEQPGPWQFYPEALSEFAGQHVALKHVFRKEKPYILENLYKERKNSLYRVCLLNFFDTIYVRSRTCSYYAALMGPNNPCLKKKFNKNNF